MKVFVVLYNTVYAYSDGTIHKGVEGVYSSRELAEKYIDSRKQYGPGYNDTSYEIEECEVK